MTKTEFAKEFHSLKRDHLEIMELYEKEMNSGPYGCALEEERQDQIDVYQGTVVSLVELYLS
jgi:hypothetical protein